jgi:large subunit ribosomal protein L22
MFNCVTGKLTTLICHSKLQPSLNSLRKCIIPLTSKTDFSTSSSLLVKKEDGPKRWLAYNDVVYPPQAPDEEQRPAVSYFLVGVVMCKQNLLCCRLNKEKKNKKVILQ